MVCRKSLSVSSAAGRIRWVSPLSWKEIDISGFTNPEWRSSARRPTELLGAPLLRPTKPQIDATGGDNTATWKGQNRRNGGVDQVACWNLALDVKFFQCICPFLIFAGESVLGHPTGQAWFVKMYRLIRLSKMVKKCSTFDTLVMPSELG